MSLMTESLRRLAETRGGLGPAAPVPAADEAPRQERDHPAPPPAEPMKVQTATPPPATADAAPTNPAPVPPRPVEAAAVSREPKRSPGSQQPASDLSPAALKLRDAILKDIGRPGAGETDGQVIVIAGIQAEMDAMAAVVSLGRTFAEIAGGHVLVIDASSPRQCESEEFECDAHGFTSLIDGTRKLQEVVTATPTPHMAFVRTGLAKGAAQAVDQKAVKLMLQDCRQHFAYTIFNGGEWETKHLPLIGRLADAFYVVVRSNGTDRDTAKRAVKYLDQASVHVRGCILAGAEGRVGRRS